MNFKLPEVVYVQTLLSDKFQITDILASLVGAVVGGLLVFSVQLFFETKRIRQDYKERDYELYLIISTILNDVFNLALAYFSMLEVGGVAQTPPGMCPACSQSVRR